MQNISFGHIKFTGNGSDVNLYSGAGKTCNLVGNWNINSEPINKSNCKGYINGNTSATSISGPQVFEIDVDSEAFSDTFEGTGFTSISDITTEIRYTGSATGDFYFCYTGTFNSDAGSYNFLLFKSDLADVPQGQMTITSSGSDRPTFTCQGIVSLTTNDTLVLCVEQALGTTGASLTIKDLSVSIFSI